jgi:hypothetical protein
MIKKINKLISPIKIINPKVIKLIFKNVKWISGLYIE